MKKISAIFLVLCIILSLAACKEGENNVKTVVMTYVASPLNVPSVLEKERGDFKAAYKKAGYDFKYSDLDSGADQTAALASGKIHILNAVGGSSVLLAAANGADIVILSMYSAAPAAFAMYSRDASLTTPQSLKGKTVAGPKGTNLHELLAAYLKKGNMTTDDVNFVSMDIPSASAALENGSVDVALLGGAAAYNCEKSGKHKITDGSGLISATIVTAASRKFAKQNPEVIKIFKETQSKIVDYMLKNEESALDITAKALGLDKDAVKDMYKMYDFDISLESEDIKAIESTEKFLFDSGLIENHVDVESIVYK